MKSKEQQPEHPAIESTPAVDTKNGTTDNGGSAVPSSSLSVAVQSTEVVPVEVQNFLDMKAREINVVRASLYVRVGGVLSEVRQFCKESGFQFGKFLARPDVSISEDSAERCMNLYKAFGKVPEADLLTGKGAFNKMYALRCIEEAEVRAAVLSDPSVRADIETATANEVTAAVSSYKEKITSKERSIEGFREQLQAASKAHKEELSKLKGDESKTVKVLNAEIERLKGELATAAKLQSKADVDAVQQFREQRDQAQAELRVLAEQHDSMSKRAAKLEAEQANIVTDKKLREEKRELEAELTDKKKALKDAEHKLAELQAAKPADAVVKIEGVDLPENFRPSLGQAITYIEGKHLLLEFVEFCEGVPVNGKAVA